MSLFVTFLIGFCLGGIAGIDSLKKNTNTPPTIQPKRPRRYK